jgi:hypothetical protein
VESPSTTGARWPKCDNTTRTIGVPTEVGRMDQTNAPHEAAHSIYERWQEYLREARTALPADTSIDRILHRAIARWREHEPPELAFVPEELSAERIETRHETAEDRLLERVERGELVALRRTSDGEAVYLDPGEFERLGPAERSQYTAYDPLLARAIRRHAMEAALPSDETTGS